MLLTAQQVKLQVALSHVGRVAVRARQLAPDILDRIECALCIASASYSNTRAAKSAGKDAPATLGANGVYGPFDLIHAIEHNTALAVGTVPIGLGHDTISSDGTQGRKNVSRRGEAVDRREEKAMAVRGSMNGGLYAWTG